MQTVPELPYDNKNSESDMSKSFKDSADIIILSKILTCFFEMDPFTSSMGNFNLREYLSILFIQY